ncbi:copper resistance protein NlpE N-terminal domain-containing protein [uncultured Vibrio sp.]|uniref:copper resistance protein NlpE n=1 Tax=uncultured Vibrio sp. TaxID=114054 RepID=UPI00260EDE21|nr:copper resistance protein NlpE N-terminal domain-containing protein [uncultured Vibrio sp.]
MTKYSLAALMIAATALVGCQDNTSETQPAPSVEQAAQEQVDAAHSARSALDWNGMYRGMVPCSDCAGTNLLLELKSDGQYSFSRSYVDKMSATVMVEGELVWNDSGNTIQVDEYRFFVGENQLWLVDQAEERLTDEQGKAYTLTKEMGL